ncbi:hypothetical protein ABI214_14560 [Prescottella soli]|uniref:Uncharacterized protein n=1 Tax=Prescottella soli TaxID=1543852 RepID=A0ABW9FXM0_9NOCA
MITVVDAILAEPIVYLANPATFRPRLSDVLSEALRDAGLSVTVKTLREIPGDKLPSGVHDPGTHDRAPGPRAHRLGRLHRRGSQRPAPAVW